MQAESSEVGSHGTIYAFRGRLLTRITDPTGRVHAELTWDASDALARLVVADGALTLDGGVIQHPLLGPAHRLGDTAVSAMDWARPTEIPAIAEPGRLPPGAGGAILNAIAVLAKRAYVPALRYAGPYPTPALWRSLLRSFRTTGDEASFTADALDRMLRVAREPIPIDFAPAPHERIGFDRGYAELRGGLHRAVLDGVSYEPDGSPARLVPASDGSATCEVWFGDALYADVATIGDAGALLEVRPIPACDSAMIGRDFPPPLRAALAELVAEAVPRPLADDARALVSAKPILWADLGARTATMTDDGSFLVHAALWDRIAPLGLARLALALTEALAPVVTLAALLRTSSHV
jgi:hypothetical protein